MAVLVDELGPRPDEELIWHLAGIQLSGVVG